MRIEIGMQEYAGIKIEGDKLVTDTEETAVAAESLEAIARKLRKWEAKEVSIRNKN